MNKLFSLISFIFLFALVASQGFSGDADRAVLVNYADDSALDDTGDLGYAPFLDADGNIIEDSEEIGENEEYGEVTEGILITDFTNFNVVDYEFEAEDGEVGLEEEFSFANEEIDYPGFDIIDKSDDTDPDSSAVDIDQSGDTRETINIDENGAETGESVVTVDVVDESDDVEPDNTVDIDQSGDAETINIDENGAEIGESVPNVDIVDESDDVNPDAVDIDQSGDAETIDIDGNGGDIVDESDENGSDDGVDIDQGGESVETINIDENGAEIGESVPTIDIVDESDGIDPDNIVDIDQSGNAETIDVDGNGGDIVDDSDDNGSDDGVDIDQSGDATETINIDENGAEIGESVATVDIIDESDDSGPDDVVDIDENGDITETIDIDGNGGEIGGGVETTDVPNPSISVESPDQTDQVSGVTFDAQNGDITDNGDEPDGDSDNLNDDGNDGSIIEVAFVPEKGFLP